MEKSFRKLSGSPFRRASFNEAELVTSLAHQIRILRLQRDWTQKELAKRLGSTQAVVSRLEDPSYGKASIQTLLKIGAVFDVALTVRFGSFVSFFKDAMNPSRESLEVSPFEEEADQVGFVNDSTSSSIGVELIESKNSSSAERYLVGVDGVDGVVGGLLGSTIGSQANTSFWTKHASSSKIVLTDVHAS